MKRALLLALAVSSAAACSSTPPPGWQQGGATLDIARARWVNGSTAVDIDEEGRVLANGEHVLNIDRAGRVFDPYNEPIAVLQSDGYLIGPDEEPMGWVGAGEAILPGGDGAWVAIAPSGEVVHYVDDGAQPFGVWMGCNHAALIQSCTLITHLMGQQILQSRRRPGFGVGVGVGVGVGLGVP